MSQPTTPIEVFWASAPNDEPLCSELETHLSLLKRQGAITTWHRRDIAPGTDWTKAIDAHLGSASVILLLISPDFVASDYCYGVELKRAMERHDANEARVIPVLLRPVADWGTAPFARLSVLPSTARPITKWRNRDDAWANVVEGIRRAIEELPRLTVSTPRTTLPPVWNIPYPRNPVFTGREVLLERLAKQLQIGQPMALTQPQAMSGLGGIGKTQLAVEYAYRFHQHYQAVLWTRAESREALISSFVTIAGLLNLPEKDAQEQMLTVNAVKAWLRTHTQWVLILDNADDLAIIPEFLPPVYGGHVLLTTRAQAMGRLAQRIEVDTLAPDIGALFLLRRAGSLAREALLDQAVPPDREAALQVTEELGGLPLALDQAGAYIEETGCSLADYQQLYQHRRAELLKERRGLVADHPDSVATTVSLAVQRIEQRHPAAAELLRFCAFLAPDAISEEIIMQGVVHLGQLLGSVAADAFLLNQAIEVLRTSSLVLRDPGSKTLSIHRLVQVVLRDPMRPEEIQQWTERTVRAVNAAFPAPDVTTWTRCQQLLPHALQCKTWIEQYDWAFPEAARLLDEAGLYLEALADYPTAQTLCQQALAIRQRSLGSEHAETATSLFHLGRLYWYQYRYEEAIAVCQRALTIREQTLGPTHPKVAEVLHQLGMLYRYQGKFHEAEAAYQRALAIREQQLGAAHPDVADSLYVLGGLYWYQRKYRQAETFYLRALAIRQEVLVPTHPDIASSLHNLASLYLPRGRYGQAKTFYLRALATRREALVPTHPDIAASLQGLGKLYWRQGRYQEAEQAYKEAKAIFEQLFGPRHLDVASCCQRLGQLYTDQGRYQEAEEVYLQARTIID